jgi:dipeptidyl aminopeptidase/acylaminoacyl peptidase
VNHDDHDGVFSTRGLYYTTDELFFPEFEFGGPPFGEEAARERYCAADPAAHVDEWRTPTLVIQGGKVRKIPSWPRSWANFSLF